MHNGDGGCDLRCKGGSEQLLIKKWPLIGGPGLFGLRGMVRMNIYKKAGHSPKVWQRQGRPGLFVGGMRAEKKKKNLLVTEWGGGQAGHRKKETWKKRAASKKSEGTHSRGIAVGWR